MDHLAQDGCSLLSFCRPCWLSDRHSILFHWVLVVTLRELFIWSDRNCRSSCICRKTGRSIWLIYIFIQRLLYTNVCPNFWLPLARGWLRYIVKGMAVMRAIFNPWELLVNLHRSRDPVETCIKLGYASLWDFEAPSGMHAVSWLENGTVNWRLTLPRPN